MSVRRTRIIVAAILLAIVIGGLIGTYVHAATPARKPICGWVRKSPCWAEKMSGTCWIKRCR